MPSLAFMNLTHVSLRTCHRYVNPYFTHGGAEGKRNERNRTKETRRNEKKLEKKKENLREETTTRQKDRK
jgi:hypothetical protein